MRRAVVIVAVLLAVIAAVVWSRSDAPQNDESTPSPTDAAASPLAAPPVAESTPVDSESERAAVDNTIDAAPADTQSVKRRVLYVVVKDGATGQPLSDSVTVDLTPQRLFGTPAPPAEPIYIDDTDVSRKTDESGRATFEFPPLGRAKLRVHDLVATAQEVKLEIVDVPESTVELTAWRTAELRGRVVDASGAPISGGYVNVVTDAKPRGTGNGWIDHSGSFRVPGIEVRELGKLGVAATVRASHKEYLDEAKTEVVLRSGMNELPAPLVLSRRGATIRGRVIGANELPSSNAEVRVEPAKAVRPDWITARTAADGSFAFTGLQAGDYVVRSDSNCHGVTAPISVTLGATVDLGDLRSPAERFEVSGYAVFEDGSPAAGAWVSFGRDSVELDATGHFSLWSCERKKAELAIRWDENDSLYWKHVEPDVEAGGPPLRIVLKPKGLMFRAIDRESRELIKKGKLELFAHGVGSGSGSGMWPQSPGEFRYSLENFDPPYQLRFVIEGYAPVETTVTPPANGYTERTVLEIEFTRVK